MLKDACFKNRVKEALPVLKQPYTQAAQEAHKNTILCIVQKIAFAWVKSDGKLRLWKDLLYLEDTSEKIIYLKKKGKK